MLPFRDHNPSRSFPIVTLTIVILNVLVFLYMVALEVEGTQRYLAFVNRAALTPSALTGGYAPPDVLRPIWLTVFTSMFMHGSPLHIAGNMLYLWIFGNNIEDIMGGFRFVVFYLVCGIIAMAAHVLSDPTSQIPTLGASGAIAGVLGAYLVRFPRAQVDTCVFFIIISIIRLPAIAVLAFWFILQLASGVASLGHGATSQGGTAWWAHIGGFIAGMLLVNLFAKRPRRQYNEW